jgi:hypothetical protein
VFVVWLKAWFNLSKYSNLGDKCETAASSFEVKSQAAGSAGTLATLYRVTQRDVPENSNIFRL